MDTLHRLAGVQEVKDSAPSSRPAGFPEPPPIPDDEPQLNHRASRASLPLNRQPSHKSFRSARSAHKNRSTENVAVPDHSVPGTARPSEETAHSADESESDEFPWGPTHPCFPHPNPHCSPDSEEYRATRVIRVRRDWLSSGDLYPQYANLYPEILDPVVSESDFRFLITNLNTRLEKAFNPFATRAWIDAALGVATGFIWDDMGFTGAKSGMKGIEQFLDKWNAQKAAKNQEVRLVQLRRTGFMALDFVIPDPGIDMALEPDIEEHGLGTEAG